MKKLLLLFLLLFLSSCQKKEGVVDINIDKKKAGKLELITDTLIQNQAVVVRYYKRNSKQKDLFCNYQYSIKQDDRFNHYKTKTPIKETETYFEFIDTVPENASTANITIYDLILQCILIIYTTKENRDFAECAAINSLVHATPENYMNYFNYEREKYPNNYCAFVKKWFLN